MTFCRYSILPFARLKVPILALRNFLAFLSCEQMGRGSEDQYIVSPMVMMYEDEPPRCHFLVALLTEFSLSFCHATN